MGPRIYSELAYGAGGNIFRAKYKIDFKINLKVPNIKFTRDIPNRILIYLMVLILVKTPA
jgi:hypothetical protein